MGMDLDKDASQRQDMLIALCQASPAAALIHLAKASPNGPLKNLPRPRQSHGCRM